MAKKTSRSEANDTRAPVAEKRKMNPGKLNSAVEGPEAISRQLDAAADQVQQAPGDALAASEGRWTDDRTEPSEQDIRDRAYQMYLERGAHHGQDFDDWLRAEGELKQRR